MTRISGSTRLAGIIGWPLSHSLSPAMHNAAYEAMDLDWAYIPLAVEEAEDIVHVAGALRVLPFVGVNVTMPYKEAALGVCDETAMFAQLAGAVNTIHVVDGRLIGYNTDGRGFLAAVENETGFVPAGKHVALIGAGGAAGAALVALVLGDAASITVVNRSLDRAEAMLERIEGRTRNTAVSALEPEGAEAAVAGADLVVNATPVGMGEDDDSPVPADWLSSKQLVADMVYRPAQTALMTAAQAAGATVVGGLGMLIEQGATAIEIWSASPDVKAPRDVMRAAAEAVLRG